MLCKGLDHKIIGWGLYGNTYKHHPRFLAQVDFVNNTMVVWVDGNEGGRFLGDPLHGNMAFFKLPYSNCVCTSTYRVMICAGPTSPGIRFCSQAVQLLWGHHVQPPLVQRSPQRLSLIVWTPFFFFYDDIECSWRVRGLQHPPEHLLVLSLLFSQYLKMDLITQWRRRTLGAECGSSRQVFVSRLSTHSWTTACSHCSTSSKKASNFSWEDFFLWV